MTFVVTLGKHNDPFRPPAGGGLRLAVTRDPSAEGEAVRRGLSGNATGGEGWRGAKAREWGGDDAAAAGSKNYSRLIFRDIEHNLSVSQVEVVNSRSIKDKGLLHLRKH